MPSVQGGVVNEPAQDECCQQLQLVTRMICKHTRIGKVAFEVSDLLEKYSRVRFLNADFGGQILESNQRRQSLEEWILVGAWIDPNGDDSSWLHVFLVLALVMNQM